MNLCGHFTWLLLVSSVFQRFQPLCFYGPPEKPLAGWRSQHHRFRKTRFKTGGLTEQSKKTIIMTTITITDSWKWFLFMCIDTLFEKKVNTHVYNRILSTYRETFRLQIWYDEKPTFSRYFRVVAQEIYKTLPENLGCVYWTAVSAPGGVTSDVDALTRAANQKRHRFLVFKKSLNLSLLSVTMCELWNTLTTAT